MSEGYAKMQEGVAIRRIRDGYADVIANAG